jgi:hypothetical protein
MGASADVTTAVLLAQNDLAIRMAMLALATLLGVGASIIIFQFTL